MIAVVPVRDGLIAAGGAEAVAEAGGRALLVGSSVIDAVADLPANTYDIGLAEAGDYRPAAWSFALAAELAAEDTIVLPGSADGRDLAPALAVRLGRPLATGVLRIDAERWVAPTADHRALAVHAVSGPMVATIDPGTRAFRGGPPERPDTHEISLDLPDVADPSLIEISPPDPATIDLEEARRVIAGGIGLADESEFERLGRVAAALGASVGATRPVVDAGWTDFPRQIGTTGALIDPDLYIAVAISGAVQHTSGLGDPDRVICINTDPSCPMMQLADLAVVADGPAVLAALEQLLDAEATDDS